MELRTTRDPGFIPLKRYPAPQPLASPMIMIDMKNNETNALTVKLDGMKMNCNGIVKTGQKNSAKQR
jgi:hypothetical protein